MDTISKPKLIITVILRFGQVGIIDPFYFITSLCMFCFLCLIVNSSRAGSVSDPSLCLVVPAPHEVRGGCRHLLTGTGRWGNRDKRLFLPLRSLPCNETVKRRRGIVADCCTEPVL